MDRRYRFIGYYVAIFTVAVVGFTLVYDFGMSRFEGEPTTLLHAFQMVVETFTTTGYGSDAPWASPEMGLVVVAMQFVGVLLVFTALPLVVVPLLEASFATAPPTSTEATDHVVVCHYTARGETLIAELTSWDVDYVVVEPDRGRAEQLHEDGYAVVHGDPQSIEVLEAANVAGARAVVADGTDEQNASIVLSAKAADPEVRVLSLVEDSDLADYLRYAGADAVLSPRELLGRSLGETVSSAVTAEFGDAISVGEDIEIAELPVRPGSELAGRRIDESAIRERTGANVVAGWFGGRFESPPRPATVIDERSVLVVTGREEQLERLKAMTLSEARRSGRGPVVVAGHGETGQAVTATLAAEGVPYTVIDIEEGPSVDVVGDATDPETLRAAGIADAASVVLALADDTTTVFATLVAREVNQSVEVVAHARETESVQKMYRAGANYVLALATVSGRMLASTIIDEAEVVSFDKGVKVVRTAAPGLAGQSLREADVRARTGCTVVGVQRNGTVVTDLTPEFVVESGDEVIVAGTDRDVNRFTETTN